MIQAPIRAVVRGITRSILDAAAELLLFLTDEDDTPLTDEDDSPLTT